MSAVPLPPPVYAIADADALASVELSEAVVEMAAAGIEWIQLRAKNVADEDLYRCVEGTLRRLEGSAVKLWINDRVDLASLLPVHGVHLGQKDLAPVEARSVIGSELWIGASTHSTRQVREADRDAAVDVIAVGPIFPTTGKAEPDPAVGLEGLAAARRLTQKPLVAIGGIDATSLPRVLAAGADAAAMIGAVCRGPIGSNCRHLLEAAKPSGRPS